MINQILNMARTLLAPFMLAFIATESVAMPTHSIVTVDIVCNITSISASDKRCYPCNAGYHKSGDCVEDGEQARCTPCSPGTFNPSCSVATSCAPCSKYCRDRRLVRSRECTPFADIECTCKSGYFWEAESSNTVDGVCMAHSPCKSGFGLKEKGDAYNDTVCEPCRSGATFSISPSFEPCRLCTVCEHYNTTCTPFSDATCSTISGIPPLVIVFIAICSFVAICFGIPTTIVYFRGRLGCQKRVNQGTSNVESQTGTQLDSVLEPLLPTGDRARIGDTTQSSDGHANADDKTDVNDDSSEGACGNDDDSSEGACGNDDSSEGACGNDDSSEGACGNDADNVETRDETTCKLRRLSDNQTDSKHKPETHLGTCPLGEDDKRLHSVNMVEAVYRHGQNPEETEENSNRGTTPISSEDKRLHSAQMKDGVNNFQICQQPDQTGTESTGQRETAADEALVPECQNACAPISKRNILENDLTVPEDQHTTMSTRQNDTVSNNALVPEDQNAAESTGQRNRSTDEALVPEDQNAAEYTGQSSRQLDDAIVPKKQIGIESPGKRARAADNLRTPELAIPLAEATYDRQRQNNNNDLPINRPRKGADKNVWRKPFTFLGKMSPNDFKPFFRSLADFRDVDSWIDVAKQENHNTDECQYQLMLKLHKRQPSLSNYDVIRALRDVELNSIAEEYGESFLNDHC